MEVSEAAKLLVSKSVAPIKREFLVFRAPGGPAAQAAGGGGDGGGAAAAAAAPAGGGASGSQQQAAAVTTGGKAAERKSKNQLKRERHEQNQRRVCVNFFARECTYGDKCRFSHDAALYLASKPPDLPGDCPFVAAGAAAACPYGLTCRWATKHRNVSGERARAAVAAAAAAAAAATAAPGAAGQQEQQEQQQEQQQQRQQEQKQDQEQAPAGATSGAGVELVAIAAAAGTSCWPLPPLRSVERPLNILDKEVQQRLWKGGYDFGRANAVLMGLGITPAPGKGGERGKHAAGKPRAQQHQRQQQRQQQQQQQAQAAQQQAQAAQQGPESAQNGAAQAPDAHAGAPAAKRARVENSGDVAAAVGAAGGDALEDLYASADAGGGDGGEAAAPEAGGAAAAAAEGAAATAANGAAAAAAAASPAKSATQPAAAGDGSGAAQQAGAAAAHAAMPDVAAAAAAVAARRGEYVEGRTQAREKKRLDLRGKTYLAPLTTVGNLPFRRLCKGLGCEVTCGEMALTTNLLQGQSSEWALLKRHPCEDVFGVQVCGGYPDAMARLCQVVSDTMAVDFVDLNCGCPIDIICARQAGSALLLKPRRFEEVVRAAVGALDVPLIIKMRKGYNDGADIAHELIPQIASWGASAVTLHGRTRQQRYSRQADWPYIRDCAAAAAAAGIPLVGNGDIMGPSDWEAHMTSGGVATCMIGRGALIKPWIFTEIRERRLWDISAGERFDQIKQFVSYGLEHWGSDDRGVETTRRFLLEWLSFTHRYVPVGLLEVLPQQMHWRPPTFKGRNDLETLLGSESAADWVRISEMLLGPAPQGFAFVPKHKTNSYSLNAVDAELLAQGKAPEVAAAAAAGGADDDGEENG